MKMDNPIAFITQTGDTMHLHQALMQPDKDEFLKSMVRELQMHQQRNHCKLVPVMEVPMGVQILNSIWSVQRKKCIRTREVH